MAINGGNNGISNAGLVPKGPAQRLDEPSQVPGTSLEKTTKANNKKLPKTSVPVTDTIQTQAQPSTGTVGGPINLIGLADTGNRNVDGNLAAKGVLGDNTVLLPAKQRFIRNYSRAMNDPSIKNVNDLGSVAQGASFVNVKAGDTWEDVVYNHYGPNNGYLWVDQDARAAFALALARVNGYARGVPPQDAVMLPDLAVIQAELRTVRKSMVATAAATAGTIAESQSVRSAVSSEPPGPGSVIRPQVDETLESLVLQYYGDSLKGLPPEAAQEKAKLLMFAIAHHNHLSTFDVGHFDKLSLPSTELSAEYELIYEKDPGAARQRFAAIFAAADIAAKDVVKNYRAAATVAARCGPGAAAGNDSVTAENCSLAFDNASAQVTLQRIDKVLNGPGPRPIQFGFNIALGVELAGHLETPEGHIELQEQGQSALPYFREVFPEASRTTLQAMVNKPSDLILVTMGAKNERGAVARDKADDIYRELTARGILSGDGSTLSTEAFAPGGAVATFLWESDLLPSAPADGEKPEGLSVDEALVEAGSHRIDDPALRQKVQLMAVLYAFHNHRGNPAVMAAAEKKQKLEGHKLSSGSFSLGAPDTDASPDPFASLCWAETPTIALTSTEAKGANWEEFAAAAKNAANDMASDDSPAQEALRALHEESKSQHANAMQSEEMAADIEQFGENVVQANAETQRQDSLNENIAKVGIDGQPAANRTSGPNGGKLG